MCLRNCSVSPFAAAAVRAKTTSPDVPWSMRWTATSFARGLPSSSGTKSATVFGKNPPLPAPNSAASSACRIVVIPAGLLTTATASSE